MTHAQTPEMDVYEAIEIAETGEADETTLIQAWQMLIDTGLAWQLQGWFGRTASILIERGVCHVPKGMLQ